MEVSPTEGLGTQRSQHMPLGQGPCRLDEVQDEARPAPGIGVTNSQARIEADSHGGEMPLSLQEAKRKVQKSIASTG